MRNKFSIILATFLGLSILFSVSSCKEDNSLPTLEELQKRSEIHSGKGTPSPALGKLGDFYIDSETMMLYGAKTEQGWGNGYPLYGKDGKDGANGKDGVNGKDGKDGANGKDGVNGKDGKDGLNGKDGVNGKDGKDGLNGKDGINGKDGSLILGGEGAPSPSLGKEGDWYIDKQNKRLYGPKTADGWGNEYVDLSIATASMPRSTAECKALDLDLLRAIAETNGFAEDIASDNLAFWDDGNIKVIWEKNTEGKYAIAGLIAKKGSVLKNLTLKDETNTLADLRTLVLNAEALETLELTNIPKLEVLRVNGLAQAPLSKVKFSNLPALTTVAFVNLPNLKTSNESNAFKFHYYYGYPELKNVTVKNTGITDLYLEPTQEIEQLDLQNNKALDLLYFDTVQVPELDFKAEDYPVLRTLTLKRVKSQGDKTLKVKGLPNLTTLMVMKSKDITGVELSDAPKLKEATMSGLMLAQAPKLANLPALKNLDMSDTALAKLDLSSFPVLKTLTIRDNNFVTTQDIKFPSKLTIIRMTGNKLLEYADFSSCPMLEDIQIANLSKHKLAYLNITGLTKLYRVSASFNSLTEVVMGDTKYNDMEEFELDNNNLTLEALAKLYKPLYNSIIEEDYLEAGDVKLGKQVWVIKPENGKSVSLKKALDIFKANGENNPFTLEVYTEADQNTPQVEGVAYNYDETTGLITFLKSGKYSLYFTFTDQIYSKIFTFDSYESQLFDVVVQ